MSEMGLFGIKIPEAYGGLDLSFECYAGVCMELARGWMSLAGIINTHVLVGYAISEYGTEEQKQKYLPEARRAGNPLRADASPSPTPAPTPRRSRRRRNATATTTSSTARRCG